VNADLSVAPEIAQLAAPLTAPRPRAGLPATEGRLAADLAELAAAPERWWDLVRFDPAGPVRVPLPGMPGAWLLVLPPGGSVACDCAQATALAGEAAESRPLRPGRVLVHGAGRQAAGQQAAGPRGDARAAHRLHAGGPGYSVTLHATSAGPRSLPGQA
jgi:hypothetical protein